MNGYSKARMRLKHNNFIFYKLISWPVNMLASSLFLHVLRKFYYMFLFKKNSGGCFTVKNLQCNRKQKCDTCLNLGSLTKYTKCCTYINTVNVFEKRLNCLIFLSEIKSFSF